MPGYVPYRNETLFSVSQNKRTHILPGVRSQKQISDARFRRGEMDTKLNTMERDNNKRRTKELNEFVARTEFSQEGLIELKARHEREVAIEMKTRADVEKNFHEQCLLTVETLESMISFRVWDLYVMSGLCSARYRYASAKPNRLLLEEIIRFLISALEMEDGVAAEKQELEKCTDEKAEVLFDKKTHEQRLEMITPAYGWDGLGPVYPAFTIGDSDDD